MNTVLQLAVSPAGSVLWKWTLLLALGWAVHGCLRRAHPRWRLILWRSILIFSLALPLVCLLPLPALVIPLHEPAVLTRTRPQTAPSALKTETTPAKTAALIPESPATLKRPAMAPMEIAPAPIPSEPFPWKAVVLATWSLGCVCGATRLIWFQAQLARLRRQAEAPPPALTELAEGILMRFNVRRKFQLRISNAIHSPFVCGLGRPIIMLPQRLMETLSPDQMAALLRHEVAHLHGRDLLWSAGWRWLQVIGWFQPLIWRIPAAHGFACEQEADRIASGHDDERKSYTQFLAQLTLRVLALPKVETELTLNGSAQIVRRLKHLQRAGLGAWTRRHNFTGFCLVGLLFLIAVGCKFTKSSPETIHQTPGAFKEVMVEVQDENGKPIQGAHVTPFCFRVKGIHAADAYGWTTNVFGPEETAVTGADGRAFLRYAVMGIPEEKEYTGALIFSVTDPQYSTVTIQDYPVDQTNAPIQMIRGITLEVSAYYGSDHQPVPNLVPNLADGGVQPEDWQRESDGTLVCHKLSPGGHLLQLMGRLTSGEIVYSDTALITAEQGKVSRLTLEMKPSIRLEGQLDDRVPRPVENGRVMIDIRPPEYPATNGIEDFYALDDKYGSRSFWHSYRPINADGTFVFQSVPPGEADVVVLGDGFSTKSEGKLYRRVNGAPVKGPRMTIPEAFPLTAPVTRITVETEPTATLEFKAITKSGEPIDDVSVGMSPSAFRMHGMYGWVKNSSEAPFREIPPLPDLSFSGKTGANGLLVIRNIPAEDASWLGVASAHYQVPLQEPKSWRDRYVHIRFEPGMTNELEIKMEPKGADYIGTAK